MATRVITLWPVHVKPLTTSLLSMNFLIDLVFILKEIKADFKGSNDKQHLTFVVTSMQFMKLVESLFHKFHMK